jgi:hypothetical protein
MSEILFGVLLKLYPRRFRDEYGEAMERLFHDRLRAETGFFGRLKLWVDLLGDAIVSVPREYWRRPRTAAAPVSGYRMSEEAVSEMAKRTHLREGPMAFLWLAIGALVGWMGKADARDLCWMYAIMALLAVLPLRGSCKFKDHWRSWELILGEDGIRQVEDGGLAVAVRRDEVTKILETIGMGMAIQTSDPYKGIWVPSAASGYAEMRQRLADWAPIEELADRRPRGAFRGHIAFGLLSLYPAALMVRAPWCVYGLAAVIGAFLLSMIVTMLVARAPRRALILPVVFLMPLVGNLVWRL